MPEEIKTPFSVSPIVTRVSTSGKRERYRFRKSQKDSSKRKKSPKEKDKKDKLGKYIDIRV